MGDLTKPRSHVYRRGSVPLKYFTQARFCFLADPWPALKPCSASRLASVRFAARRLVRVRVRVRARVRIRARARVRVRVRVRARFGVRVRAGVAARRRCRSSSLA